ncbi:MAG: bifunctional phosphoribosyl-AMP cyclohydrolase/phosphoribosyl-ATP diphosphatase HisIE [Bacteroidetes bacterium]|nr:MAG: bifunctional phosphoribosyl-AMP cyclohydrolase/phosphoribosyl-ATP diphosphatase HisIE [Bacteroidota bacterium]
MSSPLPEGLFPAIVQDADTYAVLMLGYMNAEAFRLTQETGWVTFWSRSRGRLWTKGETSGNRLAVVALRWDCDGDALLVLARPQGPTCHRGTYSCFSEPGEWPGSFLKHLQRIIAERAQADPSTSYTAQLLQAGLPRLAQKVGEEALELAIAALAEPPDRFLQEAADLVYHLAVLLHARGLSFSEVEALLQDRHERRS